MWQRLHHVLLDQLGQQGQLDWSRASLDSISVRAKRGLPNPSEPNQPRQARVQVPHLLVDRYGLPLAACLSAANTNDSALPERVVEAVPPVKARAAGPGGRASDPPSCTATGLRRPALPASTAPTGITPRIAPPSGPAVEVQAATDWVPAVTAGITAAVGSNDPDLGGRFGGPRR